LRFGGNCYGHFTETWKYWQRDYPGVHSIDIIDRNPFKDKQKPKGPAEENPHRNCCYDFSNKVWIGPDGDLCECSLCDPESVPDIENDILEIYSEEEPTEPEDIQEIPFEVETRKYNSMEPEVNTTDLERDSSELNFMHKRVLSVVESLKSHNKPLTVDNINGYLRIPVTVLLSILDQLTIIGYLERGDNPNDYLGVRD